MVPHKYSRDFCQDYPGIAAYFPDGTTVRCWIQSVIESVLEGSGVANLSFDPVEQAS